MITEIVSPSFIGTVHSIIIFVYIELFLLFIFTTTFRDYSILPFIYTNIILFLMCYFYLL